MKINAKHDNKLIKLISTDNLIYLDVDLKKKGEKDDKIRRASSLKKKRVLCGIFGLMRVGEIRPENQVQRGNV